MKKRLFSVIVFAAFAIFGYGPHHFSLSAGVTVPVAAANDSVLENAYQKRASNTQVEGQGVVVKVLADDNDGSRHQRFIVRLESGQTLLMAHNIDLAPRVSSLQAGDVIAFRGEYEWNPKGGVIHWTHRDPAGRHPAGWIRRNGQVFQ